MKLQEKQNKERFKIELRNRFAVLERSEVENTVDEYWDAVKEIYNSTAEAAIGRKRHKVKDWMTIETIGKIDQRRNIKDQINNTKSIRLTTKLKEDYRNIDKEIKKNCRRDKREHMNTQINEAEIAAQRGEQGTLFRITKKISGKFENNSGLIRDKDGNILTKDSDKQKRWKEHFEEVLNREPPKR